MKNETLRKIFEDAFAVSINMNDTFYYACADSACIDVEELSDLEPVIEKYGHHAFTAYEAIKRGHDPQIPRNCGPEFQEAKAMIKDIMVKADKYGEFYELRTTIEENEALEARERRKLAKKKSKMKDFFSFFYSR